MTPKRILIQRNAQIKKIASDTIVVPASGRFQIDTEGGAATDDLVNINGAKDGGRFDHYVDHVESSANSHS